MSQAELEAHLVDTQKKTSPKSGIAFGTRGIAQYGRQTPQCQRVVLCRSQLVLLLAPRQVPCRHGRHCVEQRRALHREGHQLLLERIALAVIGIDEEAAAESYKVVDIGNGCSIDIWELDDKALARRAAQRHAASARGRPERVLRRAGWGTGMVWEILAPDAGSLQSLASGAVRPQLVAFDFAFSTG